jgi:radical SAM/Cys-rich protein
MIRSLSSRSHTLAQQENQLRILEGEESVGHLPKFQDKLKQIGQYPLTPSSIDILQVNVGYMCNQVCKHCHVDAGPDRREIMSMETMASCLDAIRRHSIRTLDITGGAPEMNGNFRWFVESASAAGVEEIIVRSNLTILVANASYSDMPQFFADHKVRVCSSLPYYQADKTDRQRGDGVFQKSINALKKLNEIGYGIPGSGLTLDLVYNPSGAFLPGDQRELERDFKRQLKTNYEVVFNNLFTITNIPVSRFLDYLLVSGNYDEYMERLISAFNPLAVSGVMCRNTISVDWQGFLYDCDFNQMLGLKIRDGSPIHISNFDLAALQKRSIILGQHCYACTAGAGSSCQGATT